MEDKIEMFRIELREQTLDNSLFKIKPVLVYDIRPHIFSIWRDNLKCGLIQVGTPESHFIFKTKIEAQTHLVKILKNRIYLKIVEVEELRNELEKTEKELNNENV